MNLRSGLLAACLIFILSLGLAHAGYPPTIIPPNSVAVNTGTSSVFCCTTSLKTLPQGNGGTGQVANLTFNTTSAATANTTAINTALASGGHVTIDCPAGSAVYINSPLIYYSNTKLDITTACTVRALANTGELLVNYAATTAWTTLYNNSGLVTNGPLSIIWESNSQPWSNNSGSGTAYAKGNYVTANSNIYWESATTCTGATSGSGPSGTGTGISDGTCSWNYVTTNPSSVCGYGICATINWPSHGLAVGNTLWITPEPDNLVSTGNYWSGTQTAHTQGGLADSAYFGIFPVVYVNDANNITVMLERLPATAFSGIPMNVKQGDQNIKIGGGGTLDYNYPTNSFNGYLNSHCSVAAGIDGFVVDGINTVNCAKYGMEISAANFDVAHFNTGAAGNISDRIKVYGPAFNGTIRDSYGYNSDDIVSFQTEEAPAFNEYIIAAGDVIGMKATNIASDHGGQVALYPTNPYLLIDNIDVERPNLNGSGSSQVEVSAPSNSSSATIGKLSVHDSSTKTYGQSVVTLTAGQYSIGTLNIFGSNGNPAVNGISGSLFTMNGTGIEVKTLNVFGDTMNAYASVIYANTAGKVDVANIYGNNINFVSSASSYLINVINPAQVLVANIYDNYITGTPTYIVHDTTGMTLQMQNNYIPNNTRGILDTTQADTTYFSGNYAPNIALGVIRYEAAVTDVVSSGGGNTFGGTTWFTNGASIGTSTAYGFDIKCDVTKMTRTTGEYCQNTNTSPGSGTLTTAGNVMDQGTSSGSWFALYSPLTQTY